MRKFFKLNKRKRISILIAILIATLLAIVLGTNFYVAKKGKKSIEYGGGAEYVVEIVSETADVSEIATDVAQSIYERLDPLGVIGANAEAEISNDSATVRVTYPGNTTEEERKEIEDLITSKPQLVFTDIYSNPLFNKWGSFRGDVLKNEKDPGGFLPIDNKDVEEFYNYDPDKSNNLLDTKVPIVSNGAEAVLQQNGKHVVKITLEQDKSSDWTDATTYISSLAGEGEDENGKNVVLAWLDPHKFFYKMQNFDSDGQMWDAANNSLYNYAHVDSDPSKSLRTHVIDAGAFLISAATTSQPLPTNQFIIEGNFTSGQAQQLARQINYGISDYGLKVVASNVIDSTYGTSSFDNAILAGAIVMGLIALILIFNYGLLGILATIAISLFVFATLTAFTLMNAQYSPSSIAALIIGIGMSVDAVIIMFERLKTEMYQGTNLLSARKVANKKSWTTILDSNITTLIVAIVLFYFGTRSIIGLSITLILSIIFTLLIMMVFMQYIASLLIQSRWIKNNNWLVGLKPKWDPKVQKKVNKINFVKKAPWFALSSGIIMVVGIVVFTIFAIIDQSFSGGFVLSQEFAGGTSIIVQLDASDGVLNLPLLDQIFNSNGIPLADITTRTDNLVQVRTLVQFDDITNLKGVLESGFPNASVLVSNTSTAVAQQLVKDALLALVIAMSLVIVYTLIRFKWTYALSAIVALLHDVIIVLMFFIIFRLEIEPIFIAALLSIVGYSINDTIVTFDRIREKTVLHTGNMDAKAIKKIANSAIQETFKRTFLTSMTTILAIIVLMSFGNATKFTFNIAMFIGLVSGTFSSIFIATTLWIRLEIYRQKRIGVRTKKGFWNTSGVEEQTIKGINDFSI